MEMVRLLALEVGNEAREWDRYTGQRMDRHDD